MKLRVARGNSETVRESTTRPSCGPAVWMSDAALTVTDSWIAPPTAKSALIEVVSVMTTETLSNCRVWNPLAVILTV